LNYELKPISEDCYEKLFNLIDKNRLRIIRDFPSTCNEIQTKEEAKKYLIQSDEKREKKERYLMGINMGELLIGYINIKNIDWKIPKCELSYFIDEDYERKGITTSKIKQTLKFCFEELEMNKIYLRIGKYNNGSQRIAIKNGFKLEGELRKEFRTSQGELVDVLYFGLLKEEY